MNKEIKLHQWKTSDDSIRTSVEFDNYKLELLNDKIIEFIDSVPEWKIVSRESTSGLVTKVTMRCV